MLMIITMADEINKMDCELKEMRGNMNNEVDNVTSTSLNLTTLQAGQK